MASNNFCITPSKLSETFPSMHKPCFSKSMKSEKHGSEETIGTQMHSLFPVLLTKCLPYEFERDKC